MRGFRAERLSTIACGLRKTRHVVALGSLQRCHRPSSVRAGVHRNKDGQGLRRELGHRDLDDLARQEIKQPGVVHLCPRPSSCSYTSRWHAARKGLKHARRASISTPAMLHRARSMCACWCALRVCVCVCVELETWTRENAKRRMPIVCTVNSASARSCHCQGSTRKETHVTGAAGGTYAIGLIIHTLLYQSRPCD